MDALIRSNLNALVIEGDPPMLELEMAFENIRQEYADQMEDREYLLYIKSLKELTLANVSYKQIEIAVQQLNIIIPLHFLNPDDAYFLEAIAAYSAALKELIGMEFDFTDPDNYEVYLKRCINRGKSYLIERDLKTAEIEALQEKFEHAKQPDDNYFHSILINLSDHAGYHINDSITVFEFVKRLRRLIKEASEQKK